MSSHKCRNSDELLTMGISYMKDYKPNSVFCRFGSRVDSGTFINSNKVMCQCITGPFKSATLSLSFNKDEWQNVQQETIFIEQVSIAPTVLFVFIITLLIAVLLYVCVRYAKRFSLDGVDYEEVLPLNRWYLHQIYQETSEEMRVQDFLKHIFQK